MKTIRIQPKYRKDLQLPGFLKIEVMNCRYSIFMLLQNEQQIDNNQKKSVKIYPKKLWKP